MPKKTITITDIVRIFGECEIQDERGIFMPVTEDYTKDKFDIDLDFGKVGEKIIEEIFEGKGKIEVKREREEIWRKYRNIAIEIRYKGELSGISTTTAKTWIHILDGGGGAFIFPVDELKKKIKKRQEEGTLKIRMGGDNKASQLAVIPIDEVFI
tara:strand:- start:1721 stop:2185 length:465 start_codon:yes stop_codon:yes gene_type:complete